METFQKELEEQFFNWCQFRFKHSTELPAKPPVIKEFMLSLPDETLNKLWKVFAQEWKKKFVKRWIKEKDLNEKRST